MGLIGPYEILEELSPGLHPARGPRRSACMVRLSAPATPTEEAAGPARAMAPQQLLERAAALALAGRSDYWVPVLDSGRAAEQTYCVMPRYAGSIARYLAFASLNEKAVWTVLDRILHGLQEYRQKADRPHGNLTPANILLAETRGEWWRTVRLTDPLSAGELDRETAWRADLCSVGNLLFRMVLQRQPDALEIPSSDTPWVEALGPSGPAWRAFCADLLDRTHPMDLDDAVDRLARLAPRTPAGRRVRRLLFALCPVLILLAVGGWALVNYQSLPQAIRDPAIRLRCLAGVDSYDQEAWRRLCSEYQAWLGGFAERAAARPVAEAWSQHPYLEKLQGLLTEARGEFDPVRIGGETLAYSDLRSSIPEKARECGSYDLVLGGLEHVTAVRGYLGRATAEAGGWEALRYVSGALSERCAQGHWAATAEHLRRLAGALQPPPEAALREPPAPYAGADAIQAVLEWWTGVGLASRRLDERLARMAATGDPLLKRFDEAVADELGKGATRSRGGPADMDQLRGYLDEATKLAEAVELLMGKEWAALPRDRQQLWLAEATRRFAAVAKPDLDTVRLWLSELRQFSTDPSRDWVLEARELSAIASSEVLNAEWRQRRDELLGDRNEPAAADRRRSDELRGRLQTLRLFLSSLDDQSILPLPPAGLAEKAVQAKREDALRQVLALRTEATGDAGVLKSSRPVQDLCATYRRWRHDVPLLADALAAVRVHVANLYAYSEKLPPGTGGPIKALHEAWAGRDVWNAPGLPPEMSETCLWLDGLASVESRQPRREPGDRRWLRATALAPQSGLPLALAAWRRLGEADWPTGDDERHDDAAMRGALEKRLADWHPPAAERRPAVEWELRTEAERRSVREILVKLEADPDPALRRFVRFYEDTYVQVGRAAGNRTELAELAATSNLARGLAKIVMKPDWPGDYDRPSLQRGLPPPETFNERFYENWPDRAEDFRLLKPDPRGDPAAWESVIARLTSGQGVLEPFPAEKAAAVAQLGEVVKLRDGLLGTPAIRANREAIEDLRGKLENLIKTYEAAFAPISAEGLLSAEQWTKRLAQLSGDIEDLAQGNPELRALHGELTLAVKRLLGMAPIGRNASAIAQVLEGIARLEREIQDGTDPKVWLGRVMAQQTVSADALASDIWRRLRDEALQGVSAEALKTDRARYRGLRDRLRAIGEFLGGTSWDTALPGDLPSLPPGLPELAWHRDVAPALARQRQETIVTAARRSADSRRDAEAVVAAYAASQRMIVQARDQLTMADLRLAQWALPQEPLDAAGTTTVGDCLRTWHDRTELAAVRQLVPRLNTFCTELFALEAALEEVLATPSAEAVAVAMGRFLKADDGESAATPDPDAGLSRQHSAAVKLYAGYLRLGQTGWPHSLAQMAEDLTYCERLLARAPAERRTALAATLGAARRERWGKGFAGLTDCREILHGSAELLPRLEMDLRQALDTYTDLSLGAQVNLTAAWLVGQLSGQVSTEAALAARDEAVKMLTRLGTQVKYPDPMFTDIENRIKDLNAMAGQEAAAVRGLEHSGPGRIGWAATLNAERTKAVYTTTYGGTAYVLTFLRVRADAGDASRAAFVCTSELPVGLFVASCAQLTDPGGRALGERLVPFLAEELRSGSMDPRRGPRTWQMQRTAERTAPEAPPRLWLAETMEFTEADQYPAGGVPPPPTPDQPLQYIPPRAAVFFCLALGCRLPTAYEWQQLGQGYPADSRAPNLRDESWSRQYEHVKLLTPRRRPGVGGMLRVKVAKFWPGADAFPVGEVREEDDSQCRPGNDGYLWFREVPGGGRTPIDLPIDLAGNVREYVFDDSEQLDRLLNMANLTREDIRTALTIPRKFGVIGDSALSRPTASAEASAVPLTIPAGVNGWDRGFADVGIRLAFSAPNEDVLARLRATAETLCVSPAGR